MERIKRSWTLAKASLDVLIHDKKLIIFPILSGIGAIIVTLSFLIPTLLGNFMDNMFDAGIPVFGYVVLFLFYLVQYTVVYFFSTALVGAAMIRLRGGEPTIKEGLSIAVSRLAPIIGWALLSATVGLVLNMLSNHSKKKSGGIGTIINSILGAAWNIITFLVVPIVAIEGLGPINAVKRSWSLLKRSWGEQIAGTLSINAVFVIIGIVGSILLVGLGIGLSILIESILPAIFFGVVVLVFIIVLSLLSSALTGIFSAAVYSYAVDGQVTLFDENLIKGAINP